jgi:oligoendopeptidase F
VNSLYSYFQTHPEGFQEKYLGLLEAGGSLSYEDSLKPFGLNINDQNFWKEGLNGVVEYIREFKKLAEL